MPEGRDININMNIVNLTSETNLKDRVDEEAKRDLAQLCCLFLILCQGAQPEETRKHDPFTETGTSGSIGGWWVRSDS